MVQEITMTRHRLDELEKAIADNQKRGYTVVGNIQKVLNQTRLFNLNMRHRRYDNFDRVDGYEVYCVRMRREVADV